MFYPGEIDANSPYYPKLLKEIKNHPKKIYYTGDLSCLAVKNCIGVVGTRNMSTYGKRVLDMIFSQLFASNITIASGFMYGVDYYAHKCALEYNIRTIAVMPCGVDIIYPYEHVPIYKEILNKGGLIISEFENGFKPMKWTFPKRNRIIAGISRAVLVIEAGERSGALITAKYAKMFSRKVFSVPGSIFEPTSVGTNILISSYAQALTSGDMINEFFDSSDKGKSNIYIHERSYEDDSFINEILDILKNRPMSQDDIHLMTRRKSQEISSMLTVMITEGLIIEKGGAYYACQNKINHY